MSGYRYLCDLQRECIDATKIFDYVLTSQKQCFENVRFTFTGDIPDGFAAFPVSSCEIDLDSSCDEISDPNNRPIVLVELPDGTDVELEVVTFQKTINLTVVGEFLDTTGAPITTGTATATVVFCPEEVLLCAPTGTIVDCLITDTSSCAVETITPEASSGMGIGNVTVLACQSIQSYAPVKLEILAKICDPRSIIPVPTVCEVNPFPQQCPSVFPGAQC
ncbi:hypothetical protein [Bacillus solimangrovi]|uniref:DUF3992 domain-containing protein n=1 Tax=Bacillus solimangrovi TaxID=1305675 RepID=A0A1E5LEL2_9BACI|nr:hypothetical protein [Bacillus solimangrovi]OEH92516.1 hypothetical protein BFG57_15370 [Bacillus solimangrovi]